MIDPVTALAIVRMYSEAPDSKYVAKQYGVAPGQVFDIVLADLQKRIAPPTPGPKHVPLFAVPKTA